MPHGQGRVGGAGLGGVGEEVWCCLEMACCVGGCMHHRRLAWGSRVGQSGEGMTAWLNGVASWGSSG